MALKMDVQQRNAAKAADIERVARMSQGDDRPAWLDEVLESRELDQDGGILVEYEEVPDQGATLCFGTWLTATREFWTFEVAIPDNGEGRHVESFENVTALTSTREDMPGIGKSFGALAIEVMTRLAAEEKPGAP